MKTTFGIITILLMVCRFTGISQNTFQYDVALVPVSVSNLPGLHSYAYAQHQGKWLVVGGRKDGLHPRQPFNSFPSSQNNTDIFVIDVANNQFWSSTVNGLPTGIKEQLQSTNMNFHQDGDTLYIIGGYGHSASNNDHITYPQLTTIQVSELMDAIENGQPITSCFKQLTDTIFAVTGGHLEKLNGVFYLVGGQRFDGRYNPMGNPTYTQSYTNQVRMFTIYNSGNQLIYSNFSAITDPVHLRRRDYNLLPQIFPNGEEGFMISSGVFQLNVDLPFLYPVNITQTGLTPITGFNQLLSNYHSATAVLYDSLNNHMHSLFFGGMAQYHYQNGLLTKDDLVPFVKTISRVTRDGNGNLTEYQLPVEMPAFQGASAEFIPNLSLPHYANQVCKLNEISQNSFLIGHIYGGIISSDQNPFSVNQTNNTAADSTIFEVWLTVNPNSISEHKINGKNPYDVLVYPNPFKNKFNIEFNTPQAVEVRYYLTNNSGQIVFASDTKTFSTGANTIEVNLKDRNNDKLLYLTVIFDEQYFVSKKLSMQ